MAKQLMHDGNSIAAVVVTYNRLTLLKRCIHAIRSQVRKLDEIIIVDNSSTDDTPKWLSYQSDLTVITQPNAGGSGGQQTGIKKAYEHGHHWVWCMDDDTEPTPDCLIKLVQSTQFTQPKTGYLASLILWKDDTVHRMNIPTLAPSHLWINKALTERAIRVNSCSFVSVLFSRSAIKKAGLPIFDLFIWYDDVEYTNRISQTHHGYLILESIAYHNTPANDQSLVDKKPLQKIQNSMAWKYQLGLRNKVYFMRKSISSNQDKVISILILLAQQMYRFITRKISFRMLYGGFQGIFFNPKIEYIEE